MPFKAFTIDKIDDVEMDDDGRVMITFQEAYRRLYLSPKNAERLARGLLDAVLENMKEISDGLGKTEETVKEIKEEATEADKLAKRFGGLE